MYSWHYTKSYLKTSLKNSIFNQIVVAEEIINQENEVSEK